MVRPRVLHPFAVFIAAAAKAQTRVETVLAGCHLPFPSAATVRYPQAKIQENVQAEIMQVLLEESRDS